jgi:large conductance mechanosensitive channel
MVKGFKDFIAKHQVLGLAIAVILGGAVGKIVSSLVADILMPIISLAIPGGEWRTAKLVLTKAVGPDGKEVINALNYGSFFGSIVDFIVIAFCIYMITKALIKEEVPAPPPPSKACPRCKESIAPDATKCKYCTADL